MLDTDRYVAMVAPLAEDPAVQEEISRRITDAVFEALRVEELTTRTLEAVAERPRVEGVTQNLPVDLTTFAEPISTAIHGFTEQQVTRLVASAHVRGRLDCCEPRGARQPRGRPHRGGSDRRGDRQ